MTTDDNLARIFLLDDPAEQSARLREGRIASSLMLGHSHPVSLAFNEALRRPHRGIPKVCDRINELPALQKRRLLSVLARALPAPTREAVDS